MRVFLSSLFFLGITVLSAQPKMTLWRVQPGHDTTVDKDENHTSEQYACGAYYFFVSDGVAASTWSIKNEGTSNLELQLPLGFDPNSATSMEINLQPDKAVLAPGEETHFRIKYDFYGVHGDFFLDIASNDPINGSCGLLVGGNVLACTCFCVPQSAGTEGLTSDISGVQESRGFCSKTAVGVAAGIPLSDEPCDPISIPSVTSGSMSSTSSATGDACNPIAIADPCSCDNTITTAGGQFLFRDTLTVTTLPGYNMTLSDNDLGFLDSDGNSIMAGTSLGVADAAGAMSYVFYRRPGEGVNIKVNGLSYVTAVTCPDASTCNMMAPDPIPTMGQWALICLALLFVIFSAVAIISRKVEALTTQ